jgi:hypothetical protein
MSLIATILQPIRANYPSNLDRDELRRTRNGLLYAAIDMTKSPMSIISADLQRKAAESEGLALSVPVMTKGDVTITNVRSCTITDPQSASALVNVIWKTAVLNVTMVPVQYTNNLIGYQADLGKKIADKVEALKSYIETDIDTALNTNKTQVYGSTIPTTDYTISGGAIQVPNDDKYFLNNVGAINFADDFFAAETYFLASPNLMPYVTRYYNQGAANSENTQFQFQDKNFGYSNRVVVAAGKIATAYFMPDGTLGFLTRIDKTARAGVKSTDGTEWDVEQLPGLPFPVGVQYKSTCADKSALDGSLTAHLTATLEEKWQFSVDYAILTPYNSDPATKAGAIRKIELVPSTTP